MSFFSALLGTASDVDVAELEDEFSKLLIEGEELHHAYKLFRDLIVFTSHRLFLIDKQGLTAKRRSVLAIPYKSVDYFCKETAGHFDLDAEIKVWIKSRAEPVALEFRKNTHIDEVFRILSQYVLK